MLIHRAYKTQLIVNNKEVTYLQRCCGAARFVFNWALADRKRRYEDEQLSTNKFEQKRRFNALKHTEYPWLAEIPYKVIDQEFENVDRAFQNFFRRVKSGEKPGYPRFKSRRNPHQSFTLRGCILVESERIKLPVIGWLRLAENDYLPTGGCKILSANISLNAGNWYVSLQVEQDIAEPVPPSGDPIGIDLGIKSLAVCSDGKTFDNPRALIQAERKLARLQRELSRRSKGGANWHKTKGKLGRAHQRVSNIRRNAQHRVSAYTSHQGAGTVVIEDLNVKGMTANHHLARAVLDSGMGELGRQIEYKCGWRAVKVIKADCWYPSSKTCSTCGVVRAELLLSERTFICPECGTIVDRDLNAARNLAALAKAESAAGLPVELGCSNASL